MAEVRSGTRTAWAGIAALALGVALWWGMGEDAPRPREGPDAETARTTPPDSPPAPERAAAAAAPAYRIAPSGRLSLEATALPTQGTLALGLELSDEARGSEPRPVRIVGVDGRVIDTIASLAVGAGTGVRLEIDPEWLRPGRYMIEVKTAEKIHLPLRRYVLEVR